MTILLVVGVAARLVRFALRFPLWYDEAALSSNFLERGYLDLLRPLECGQTSPILFLWVQLTVVKLLGFSEWTLRLFPLCCGLGSLWLFRHLAVRSLRGTAAVMAVGVFAASYPAIRYSAEGKPYGCDLFVALVLAALTVQWLRRPGQVCWLWLFAGLMPLCVAVSFTAVFAAGAASAAIAVVLLGTRHGVPHWAAWLVLNVLLVATFAATMAAARANLTPEKRQGTRGYWEERGAFPPRGSAWSLAKWLVAVHAGELLAHPFGGKHGASTLTALACATAIVLLARRRQFPLLLLLVGPAALNLVAAAMGEYPYGGHVRLAMHLGPPVCVMAGLGVSEWLASAGRRWPRSRILVPTVLSALALLSAGIMVRDAAYPARSENDLRFRGFSRWFWVNRAYDSELACLKSDFRVAVDPLLCVEGDEAMYLCYQRMFSLRHARGEAPAWDRVSADWPLRCVRFIAPIAPQDEAAFDRWRAEMEVHYRLVGREIYHFPFYDRKDPKPSYVNSLEVYEYVPRVSLAGEAAGVAGG
jgi:uncharacterized membrane protein